MLVEPPLGEELHVGRVRHVQHAQVRALVLAALEGDEALADGPTALAWLVECS